MSRSALAGLILVLCGAAVSAQELLPVGEQRPRPPGWLFTPSLTSGSIWDDNVLIQGRADGLAKDRTLVVTPGALVDYFGRKGELSASYFGSFQQYQSFDALDSFEQAAALSGRARVTPRTSLFMRGTYSSQPTTELRALVGVPFLRTGSRILETRGGVTSALSKRTSLEAAYDFQWINFDKDPNIGRQLLGGTAHGGVLGWRHRSSRTVTLTTTYEMQRASLVTADSFLLQNAWAGGEYQVLEGVKLFGAFGASRLDTTEAVAQAHATSPAWRTGVAFQARDTRIDAVYSRSFLPSYGSGGSLSNQELTTQATVPLVWHFYTSGTLSLRRNAPLTPGAVVLDSVWLNATLGYAIRPWMRVEGLFSGLQQANDRPGGRLIRNRFGLQIVTAPPMRMH